jgi:hypothetical protein
LASFVLGLSIASIYGLAFYLVFGHGRLRLLGYWLTALIGFGLGHLGASALGLTLLNLGELNVAGGTLMCAGALFGTRAWWR